MIKKLIFILLIGFSLATLAQLNPLELTGKKNNDVSAVNQIRLLGQNSQLSLDEKERLKSPRESMRTFMNAMGKVKAGNSSAFNEAILTLDLSQIDSAVRKVTGKVTAERLINTIDRLAYVNFDHIPNSVDGPKWIFRKQTVNSEEVAHDVEIAIAKTSEGVWKFTPETISSIENFYASVAHLKVLNGVVEYKNWHSPIKARMPAWTADEWFMFKKGQWLGFIAILFFSLGMHTLVRFLTTQILRFKIRQKSLDLGEEEQFKSTQPFGLLAFAITWLVGVRQLELDLEVLQVLTRGGYILTAIFAVWSALKVVDYITLHFEKMARKTANKFDDVLVPMLSKTAKVLVLSFGALLVAHSLTFDIASILAGLGIGGVAIALAAKDTISNLFGSVTVLVDRPFHLGDYVVLEKGIEGSVEEVGFRSTRIRTPNNSLVTVPNSVLANMAIDNYGMRKVRRFKTKLCLEYTTPNNLIEDFCQRVRYSLRMNNMVQPQDIFVSAYEFGHSSIEISFTVNLLSNNQESELNERHKLILEILKIAEEVGVNLAYPTQSLIIKNSQHS